MPLEGTRWSQQRAPPMRASLSGGSVLDRDAGVSECVDELKGRILKYPGTYIESALTPIIENETGTRSAEQLLEKFDPPFLRRPAAD